MSETKSGRRRFLRKLAASIFFVGSYEGFFRLDARPLYVVKGGDTLSGIARRHGCTVLDLTRSNRLESDLIRVGQRLKIPISREESWEQVRQTCESMETPFRSWRMIVGHHSAIEHGNAKIYHRAHLRRGMKNGLAYHFVIGNGIDSGDGEIEVGPRWMQQLPGGHVRSVSVNATAIGICCVGNFEKTRPSPKQMSSFSWLCEYLQEIRGSIRLDLNVHREVDPGHTVCPGRNFPIDSLRRALRTKG